MPTSLVIINIIATVISIWFTIIEFNIAMEDKEVYPVISIISNIICSIIPIVNLGTIAEIASKHVFEMNKNNKLTIRRK